MNLRTWILTKIFLWPDIDSIMKYFYEKFWIPIFGGILSNFVFLIEGKPQKLEKEKSKSKFKS